MFSLMGNLNIDLCIDLVKIDRTPFCQMHERKTASSRRYSVGSQALERFHWESCLGIGLFIGENFKNYLSGRG